MEGETMSAWSIRDSRDYLPRCRVAVGSTTYVAEGRTYRLSMVTIDNGSAYTRVRQSAGAEWRRTHLEWNWRVVGRSSKRMIAAAW
jgi:hypothetical protein